MTRSVTGLCVAAAFGCAVTLGAQAPTTSKSTSDKGKEITVTGCLSKGADGNYMLTNARTGSPSTTAGTTGTSAGTPTTSTAGAPTTTAGGATTTGGASSSNAPAMTWKLEGGTDLDKHVGHKIEVTGTSDYTGPGRNPGDTTASASPTSDPSNPTTTSSSAVGTSGSAADQQRDRSNMNQPKLQVTSVKMISSSCQ